METKQSHFPTICNLILWMSLNCYVLSWEWLSSGPRSSLTLAEMSAPYHMGLSIGLLTTWHLASFWEQQIQDRRRGREEEKREVTVFLRPNLRSDSPSLLLVFFFLLISNKSPGPAHTRGERVSLSGNTRWHRPLGAISDALTSAFLSKWISEMLILYKKSNILLFTYRNQ